MNDELLMMNGECQHDASTMHIPKLRFAEFVGEWEVTPMGKLLSFKNGFNASKEQYGTGKKFINVLDIIENNFITNNLIKGEVEISEKDYAKNEVVYGDLLFQRSSETREEVGQASVYLDENESSTFGGFVIRGRPINKFNSKAFNYLLKTSAVRKDITSRSGGSTRYNIGQDSLEQVIVNLPTLPEQEKIAAFLTPVDDRIEQLKRKKTLLQSYKKGVMQRLFANGKKNGECGVVSAEFQHHEASQISTSKTNQPSAFKTQHPLRFRQDNGETYPDWEEKKLGEVCTFSKGKGISKAEVAENGALKCIRYGELYTIYNETISEVHSSTNLDPDELILSEKNDVIIPASGETHIDIATASCVTDSSIALGGDLNIIRGSANGVFLAYYLNNAVKHKIAGLAQGSSVIHLYASQLKGLKLALPHPDEQTKIANFLTSLDTQIDQTTTQVTQTQTFKKGLLQQMFV